MKKFNYIIVLLLTLMMFSCEIENPIEGFLLKFNVDIDETIVELSEIPQGSKSPRTKINLFENINIKANTGGETSLYKAGRVISKKVFLRNELIAINGKITNHSDSEVLIDFYLEESANVVTKNKKLTSFKIPPRSSVNKFSPKAIPNFKENKDYYLCVYANGNNLNVTVNKLSLISCSDIISRMIEPPTDDYTIEEILSTDFSGTITNNGKSPVTIQIFISDYNYSNLEKDKIAEVTIEQGKTKVLSKKEFGFFNQKLYKSLIKTYVENKRKFYCRTVFKSLSELHLNLDKIKVKAKVEVDHKM